MRNLIFLMSITFSCAFTSAAVYAKTFTEREKFAVLAQMYAREATPRTTVVTPLYAEIDGDVVSAVLPENCHVVIERDISRSLYYVRDILTGESGWTHRECLDIPQESAVLPEDVPCSVIEDYAAIMGFESATDYFVITDTARRKTYVLYGKKGEFSLIKTLPCSTGSVQSPTTKGRFTISERGGWFYSERLGSGAKYWVRFNGAYLFHSQAMDEHKKLLTENNEIGKRNSNGCVRFYVDDARWFYENVPDGSGVFVK